MIEAWFEMVQETGNTVSDGLIFLDDLVSTLQTGDVWAYKIFWKAGKPIGCAFMGCSCFRPSENRLHYYRRRKRRHAGNRPPSNGHFGAKLKRLTDRGKRF